MARNYKKFIVYHEGYKLAIDLYKITDKFPDHEHKNMISQIRRAAVSIPVNIVEGSAKKYPKEFIYFLNVAYGSAQELEVLVNLSKDIGYIKKEVYDKIFEQLDSLNRKLFAFINAMENKYKIKNNFFQRVKRNIEEDSKP